MGEFQPQVAIHYPVNPFLEIGGSVYEAHFSSVCDDNLNAALARARAGAEWRGVEWEWRGKTLEVADAAGVRLLSDAQSPILSNIKFSLMLTVYL